MAEAVAAIAVVASVIACVQFAGKLTTETVNFAKSTSNRLREHRRLRELTLENEHLTTRLRALQCSGKDHFLEKSVQEKAIQCHEECKRLLEMLESLRANNARQKIVAALKSIRKQPKIEACRKRLKELQAQLSLVLLALVQSDQRQEFSSLRDCIEEQHEQNASELQQATKTVTTQMRELLQRNDNVVAKIIRSLEFPTMYQRRHDLVDAASETFNWPFSESPIADWLQKGTGIFWVRGKAGSGKSTLMKHIVQDRRTYEHLKIWANDKTLLVADHFFWISGASLQRSYQGMLQTLLHSIFRADRSLVPIVCPDRYQNVELDDGGIWSTDELFECLCASVRDSNVRYCFFIDGLDEYQPQEDHLKLVDRLKQITKYTNVKLCVSSRVWTIFENAFGLNHQTIRLEEVTRDDMKKFARSRLSASDIETGQTNLADWSSKFDGLVDDIVDKAEGVFLWTHLVLSSMHDRMLAGIDPDGLRQCLREFPSDLEEYIRDLIWARINTTWLKGRSETAYALKFAMIMVEEDDVQEVLSYWLLLLSRDCDISERDFHKQLRLQCIEDEILSQMCRKTVQILRQACKDILRITQDGHVSDSRVDFSHRSMYDFLSTAEMQTFLDENVPSHFLESDFIIRFRIAQNKLRSRDVSLSPTPAPLRI
ncbi:hypothetical protein EV356DRAFT_496816 [Viridothelium virens]|uniref:Uncharacterized protein n=1 Tax=Viridothelium virens TaxID=1048519 RepID=A0A6A6HHF1_VIRVR|nr:hypothetical protein EV356DRAFT_496816 [Viridothelium virens]